MTTVIKNEYATLVYHEDEKIVHHTFHKPIGGESFRSVLNTGIELLQKHGAIKWLSDDRENAVLSQEDTDWGNGSWFPRAKQAGWKYWGLVVPASIAARMRMKEFVDSFFEQGIRIMVFTDPDEALEWLTKQGK